MRYWKGQSHLLATCMDVVSLYSYVQTLIALYHTQEKDCGLGLSPQWPGSTCHDVWLLTFITNHHLSLTLTKVLLLTFVV